MRMKIEDAVVSEGGNPDVQDEGKNLDTTQDLSGLRNCIVVEGEGELPSRILNSTFNDTLSSSERSPQASRSSSPSISMHLRHVVRNFSPSPEPVLQHQSTPLIIANRIPSPSPSVAETFPSDPPSPLVPSNPPPSDSSPTPPLTQILPTASSSTLTQPPSHPRPPPSETEREWKQLPRAKQDMASMRAMDTRAGAVSTCSELLYVTLDARSGSKSQLR